MPLWSQRLYYKLKFTLEGVYRALEPLRSRLPPSHRLRSDRKALLERFSAFEVPLVMTNPTGLWTDILEQAYAALSVWLSLPRPSKAELTTFSGSIGEWPAFPDTVEALKSLQKRYKLVILSNVDRAGFAKVLAGPLKEIKFDAVYTAEDIGSYKPEQKNFEYLLEHIQTEFGASKEQVLHTAQSLRADHAPAKVIGLDSAWVVRGDEGFAMGGDWADFDGMVEHTWRFDSMAEIAAAVEEDFTNSK